VLRRALGQAETEGLVSRNVAALMITMAIFTQVSSREILEA
jgi:hypothetical protein